VAILLRIYEMAEFNRFGLTREMVLAEIVDYLNGEGAAGVTVLADAAQETPGEDDDALPPANDLQEYASWILRRLVASGWLEREQQADYTELIILPDYAFTLLEAFRTIQEQKPREYTGQLYAAHQLLTHQGEGFSPALALTQAYENVRQVVRGLNELNQNIRRYTERVTRPRPPPAGMATRYRLARRRCRRVGHPGTPLARPGRRRDQPLCALHRQPVGEPRPAAGRN